MFISNDPRMANWRDNDGHREGQGRSLTITEVQKKFGDCVILFHSIRHAAAIKNGKLMDEWDSRTTPTGIEYKVSEVWK